jgi:hypothetical protein
MIGTRDMTHRAQQLPAVALGAAGLALIALVAPALADVRIGEFFEDPIRSLSTMPAADELLLVASLAIALVTLVVSGHGFTAGRDAAAVASSVVPGKLLALAGVDKTAVYTDVSRDYSVTMRQLGYYPRNEKPLRIGLVGELYADFGFRGIVFGTFIFGLLVGLIPLRPGVAPRRVMPVVLLGVLAMMLLITPPPALLPIALMLLAPLVVLNRSVVRP